MLTEHNKEIYVDKIDLDELVKFLDTHKSDSRGIENLNKHL